MINNTLVNSFFAQYADSAVSPALFFAPGRVNLIGEHTDYNGGYVLPCALTFGTYLAIRRTNDSLVKFSTTNFDFSVSIPLHALSTKIDGQWVNYPLGVINQFIKRGLEIGGMELLFSGNIPNGAGLSSSASIELVTAVALNDLFQFNLDKWELVKLSQKAENEFVGMNCGIMDQFASAMGKKDNALFLDCNSLTYEYAPFVLTDYELIITNSNKKRGLVDSKYNERRQQCEKAVEDINKVQPLTNLGSITLTGFQKVQDIIVDETVRKRALHVVSEDQRVVEAVESLKNNDLLVFGQLMNQSHVSMRENFEITCFEIDTLVKEAQKLKGVIGSRMTGGGFGGCIISLVETDETGAFCERLSETYLRKTGLTADHYIAQIGDGAKRIS
jgi:galactokinase